MALSNMQYNAIMREYDEKRSFHTGEQARRQEEIYEKIPRIAELDRETSSLAVQQARRLLSGDASAVEDLKKEYSRIGQEKTALLENAGYPADYLEMRYDCPECRDTGYVNGQKCRCFKQRELEILCQQSRVWDRLEKENFSTCTDRYYSDTQTVEGTNLSVRAYMRGVIGQCRRFAENFDAEGGNLVLYGSTGVGKTFLAGCIAKELIDRLHSVVYLSASEFFERMEKEYFSSDREQTGDTETQMILGCDLLIVDDLGTELSNSWTNSQLFSCLNERLMRKVSTIITTNMSPGGLGRMYSERIGSRLIENYKFLFLPPGDIRVMKRTMQEEDRRRGGK